MFKEDALKGKVVLVVGGSTESGPPVCQVLARHGADVALTYRTHQADADQVAEKCRQAGGRAQTFSFDLTKMDQVMGLVPKVTEAMGRLDILVSLGAPPPVYRNLRELEEKDFDLMMGGHVKGCFFLAREAARQMDGDGGGLIVNVSATSSIKYGHGMYGLAKASTTQMTRFIAHAFAPTVRVINLIPGLIDIAETDKDLRSKRARKTLLGRIVTPEEIGLQVIAVASPAFASVTGESLIADGGMWLQHV